MRSFVALLGVVSVFTACQPKPAPMTDTERAAVAEAVRAAADSVVAGYNRLDPGPYADQLAGNEAYIENAVQYANRDSLLAAVRAGVPTLKAVALAWKGEPIVSVLGPDAAVLTGAFRLTMTDSADASVTHDGFWTAAYQRQDGRWIIVQVHESYTVGAP